MSAFSLEELQTLLPCDFEEWRERGEDFRRTLSHAVMRHLSVPHGWHINAEYRSEFGGHFPVQCRLTTQDEQWHLCICSPGEISQDWTVIIVSRNADYVRLIQTASTFNPEAMNALLSRAAALARMRCSAASAVDMLTKEVAA